MNFFDVKSAAILISLLGSFLGQVTHADQNSNPNIVYILADDLGWGDLKCNNPESKIPTPFLDKLASQGMNFRDAHSGSAVCTPTRYGILTGRYSWRTKLQSGVLGGYSPPLIESDRPTLPGYLKANGYHTVCFGKWHLGMELALKEGERPRIIRTNGRLIMPSRLRTVRQRAVRSLLWDQCVAGHAAVCLDRK